jgi:Gas vesicle synthesis protein GvpL/GvpF
MVMTDGALGAYAYCVMAGDARPALDGVAGVDPARPPRVVRRGDLAAVAGDVALSEFGAAPLKRNLEDVRWLERVARGHQAVLDRALEAGTVVPLRLCTVFADEAAVLGMLDREGAALLAALARLAGRAEWGVKLIADPNAGRAAGGGRGEEGGAPRAAADAAGTPVPSSGRAAQAPDPSVAPGKPGSGHAYLARKRGDRVAREEARRTAREAARAVHAGLGAEAAAATVLRAPPRELSGEAGELVLNGAYLVDRARAAEFRALADRLGEGQRPHGLRLEVTGPWPPYSFAGDRAR